MERTYQNGQNDKRDDIDIEPSEADSQLCNQIDHQNERKHKEGIVQPIEKYRSEREHISPKSQQQEEDNQKDAEIACKSEGRTSRTLFIGLLERLKDIIGIGVYNLTRADYTFAGLYHSGRYR